MITEQETGEIVCSNCGLVLSDRAIDNHAEWRAFDNEKVSRVRTGSPNSLAIHDMGLATIIGKADMDSAGHKLNAYTSSSMQRLRTWDARTRAHTSTHRNLIMAFNELDRLKDKLNLSEAIVQKTAYIYRKAQDKKLVRGRSTSSILAAAIYMTCREMEAPRSLRDVAQTTNIKRKDLARSYRLLVLELDMRVPLLDPIKCVIKIGNKANLSEKTKRMAINTMNDVVKNEISAGKDPMGLAATVLYMSCLTNGETLTQKNIADAAGVTEVTVRNRLKDLNMRLYPN
jgi:transcription initiation factor TFIIB